MKRKERARLGIGEKNDDVATPSDLYQLLNEEFDFDFDPCPLKSTVDGLSISWGKRNFVNPPYSDIRPWIQKGFQEYLQGKLSVFLIPVRTSSVYWHSWVFPFANEIRFFKGGISFQGYDSRSPISPCLVIFNPGLETKKKSTNSPGGKYVMRGVSLNPLKNPE